MPLIGSLILAAMLLVLDKMLRLFQYVVDAGGPVSVVWRMLANLLPEYLSLGIPIGLMLGILLAFRKLALSSELDALRGIGVGYGRLLRVPLCLYGTARDHQSADRRLSPALHRVPLREPALRPQFGRARRSDQGRRVQPARYVASRSESKAARTRAPQLHGIFVETDDGKGTTVAATAEGGRFLSTDDPNEISFRLTKGRLVQQSPKFKIPRTLAFETYTLPVSLPVINQFRHRGGTESDELYLHELFRIGYAGGATSEHQRLEAQARLNFRLVEVLMMFILPLLAVSLAVPPKRSTSGLGIFLAILIVVAYHKVNQYGQQAGANGQLNPILALWVPLVLFASMILLDVPCPCAPPGRPADRRARALLRQGNEACALDASEPQAA